MPVLKIELEKTCTHLKLPVRKAEFPQASIILIINEKARKVLAFSSRSKNPNKIEVTPTVPIPKFSVNFIPMRFIFAPEIKAIIITGVRPEDERVLASESRCR